MWRNEYHDNFVCEKRLEFVIQTNINTEKEYQGLTENGLITGYKMG